MASTSTSADLFDSASGAGMSLWDGTITSKRVRIYDNKTLQVAEIFDVACEQH